VSSHDLDLLVEPNAEWARSMNPVDVPIVGSKTVNERQQIVLSRRRHVLACSAHVPVSTLLGLESATSGDKFSSFL
jgi:hypothetical protein